MRLGLLACTSAGACREAPHEPPPVPTQDARFADHPADPIRDPGWYGNTLDWDRNPIDLRYLNEGHRPAGIHGPIRVEGDHLVFADGTPARLWGTNVTGSALYGPPRDTIAAQARRIAAWGFNLVRIHHHDSPWVEPNLFVEGNDDTELLSDDALASLDWWIKCLQDEGIYVWLDLHVGRQLRPGDAVPGQHELQPYEGELAGFGYVNPHIEARMHDFSRRYLGRTNRFTGRRYADDPGIVGVLVTNENDLTHHFGNRLRARDAPEHHARLRALVEPFARAHDLPIEEAMQPWRHGAAKIAMNELEARFHRRAIGGLRGLGYRGPIATTSFWGDDPMASLPALTVGDVIDVHAYGAEGAIGVDPRQAPIFVHTIAAARIEGRPLTITEWNLLPPIRDRFVGPIWMAALASLQGWDVPMHFCYANTGLPVPSWLHGGMQLFDPSIMGLMPAAALLFREGHVDPARERHRIVLDRQALYDQPLRPHDLTALRTLTERSRVEIALPDLPELDWDTPRPPSPDAIEVRDLDRSFLDEDADAIVSDTGQLRRDWTTAIGTLDTPRSQAAYGWLGGHTITLSDLELRIDTPAAAVAVTALDGEPIRRSKDLLLTTVARVENTGGSGMRAQSVTGTVRLRSVHETLRVQPIFHASRSAERHGHDPTTGRPMVSTSTRTGEHHELTLVPRPTHWYRITVADPDAGAAIDAAERSATTPAAR